MARVSPFVDPEFTKAVAQAFVDGLSRKEIAEMFGRHDLDTITRWRRDPRVKAYALKLIEDRILQVTRKTDAIIAQRLQDSDKLSVQEVIMIRKEFLGGALRSQTEKADAETIQEAQTWLENNPEAADELEKLLSGETKSPVIPEAQNA
jgi:transposase-like protein